MAEKQRGPAKKDATAQTKGKTKGKTTEKLSGAVRQSEDRVQGGQERIRNSGMERPAASRSGQAEKTDSNIYGGDTQNHGNASQGGYEHGWWDKTVNKVQSWLGKKEGKRRQAKKQGTGSKRKSSS